MPASSTVVVTGSARGIGAAVRDRLRAAGEHVLGVDRVGADLVADLATVEGREAVAGAARGAVPPVRAVVCCAGVSAFAGLDPATIVSANYHGAVGLLDALRPALAGTPGAAAVVIGSTAAVTAPRLPADVVDLLLEGDEPAARAAAAAIAPGAAYAASKLALLRWVRRNAPAAAWAGAGITLNAVSPGMVETPMVEEMRRQPEGAALLDRHPAPAGRGGRPEEIAAMVAFLLGDDARYCIGSVITVDGGTEALLRADDWPAARSTA